MKRRIALLAALVLVLTLCPALSAASTKQEISGKSYNIEVRSIDQVTSLNGKYTALETFKTAGRKKNVRKIRFAYDETEEKADITGRFTTDAKIALVRVDGFDSRLAAITDPEQVVVTVNGQPISVDSGASYFDDVGWQNVHSGSYGVVFPVELTREGGKATYEIQVTAESTLDKMPCLLTETAKIEVDLYNSHVYKTERSALIANIQGKNVDVSIVNDRIYLDYPSQLYYQLYKDAEPEVVITFSDADGKALSGVTRVNVPTCEDEAAGAILFPAKNAKLNKSSAATFSIAENTTDKQRRGISFVLETGSSIYRTQEYTVVERRDIATDDPKGIVFAETEKVLHVGERYTPDVLQVCDGARLYTTSTRKLTLLPGKDTDARVIDVEENTVIGVKPGVAYITARYVTDLPQPGGFVTYDTPSMKIIVRNESSDVRTVLCRRLNLRAAPSSSAARVGKLSRGQQVLVISESNGWAQLSDGSYAYAKYLR